MENLNTILVDIFKLQQSELTDELTMENLALWDSLKHMELITTLENEFNVELSADDIMAMISVSAIRQIIQNKHC